MLIEELDIEQYHAMPQISKTGLDMVNISPSTYHAHYLSENRPPPRARGGQLEGNLAHCSILEPDTFMDRYFVIPDNAPLKPTKAMLQSANPGPSSVERIRYWEGVESKAEGKTSISESQYNVAMRQAESVQQSSELREILSSGKPEVSAFWRDSETGVDCRCRPDWVNEIDSSSVIIGDVKTFNSVSLSDIRRQIERKRYHVQDAFYSDGYAAASGKSVAAFIFIFVDMEYPYHAIPVRIDELSRKVARVRYLENLKSYKKALSTNDWSFSEGNQIHTIELSPYI